MAHTPHIADVGIIGAGLAGLSCARWLQQAGHRVLVLEKSRGVGGRMATRRLQGTCADHGVRYLTVQGEHTRQLIDQMVLQGVLQPWAGKVYEWQGAASLKRVGGPCYIAPAGITAVAKHLAADLDIWHERRLVAIAPSTADNAPTWTLTLDDRQGRSQSVVVRSLAILIPAPQILPLLKPLADHSIPESLVRQLEQVTFDPCLTAIATYPPERLADLTQANSPIPWHGLRCPGHPTLAWIGLESSKRHQPPCPVVVVQSNGEFGRSHLDAEDLQAVGRRLLQDVAQIGLAWFQSPEVLQVHRWRYAFPRTPLQQSHLSSTHHAPLACGGDWCGGHVIESAIHSGVETGQWLHQQLLVDLRK
jgi:hypothetical protein